MEGEEISFSDEQVGIVVVFETGKMDCRRADEVMEEIRQNVELMTGEKAEVLEI